MGRRPHKVIVIGGGVAGLSAAHELAERGFEVHVYERRAYYGGKAASITIGKENPYTSGPPGMPGEHGFRFVPGWYRHLPDIMRRIPYKDRTVADNLVPADVNLLAGYNRDAVRALLRMPRSWIELKTVTDFPSEILRLGLTADDVRFFMGKMWEFLSASEERRMEIYENQTWSEFLEAPKRSRAYRDFLVEAATRNTIAAKADQASAYAIAKIALQTFFDTLNPQTQCDRVLKGPTNEVWIEPWIDYLRGLGVTFVQDAELDAIDFDDGPSIRSVRFQMKRHAARLAEERLRQIEALSARDWDPEGGDEREDEASPRRGHAKFSQLIEELLDAAVIKTLSNGEPAQAETDELVALLRPLPSHARHEVLEAAARGAEATIARANAASSRAVEGDYYVFALPIEQMAYQINRSENLKSYDPDLRKIIRLSEHVEWMAGIQFYFTDNVTITRGHIDLLDSEWSLTAIAQTQFWDDFSPRNRGTTAEAKTVRAILSVDISSWDRRGRFHRKEAYNCTAQEIAEEVWEQLKEALNRPGKQPVLRDDMLLGFDSETPGTIPQQSFYLDDSIVDRFDRNKQALYDRSRSVRFSAEELMRRHDRPGESPETPYRTGRRRMFNAEPLLVNRVGALQLRPSAKTGITNMFLAGDYVRTHTNLATMEGANEAARAAVNEVLLVSGSREIPCKIWPLSEPFGLIRAIDASLFRRKPNAPDLDVDIPWRLLAGTAEKAAKLATQTLGRLMERK